MKNRERKCKHTVSRRRRRGGSMKWKNGLIENMS